MRKAVVVAAGLLAALVAGFLLWKNGLLRQQAATQIASSSTEPWHNRPYANVRPEVRYVGDQACAECHPSETESYRRHPMGRSLQPVSDWQAGDRLSAAAHNPFRAHGLEFRVEVRDSRVFHQARQTDPAGKVVLNLEAEVQYVVGSGTRGQTFLAERDGYLFESPISWFARKRVWDLSPGLNAHQWLDRAIGADCLFCHANQVQPDGNHYNRFRPPTFRGFAIGCERCHGPGELHVQARKQGTAMDVVDTTIVNPERLEPALREAVCQQCHLEGIARVLRRDKSIFAYRPGLPLGAFWSIYVAAPSISQGQLAVGQVEQMYESKCFRASQGRLGCISCHDPHDYPAAADRVDYYRGRCLECHQQQGCRLGAADREQRNKNDCVACHMPPLRPYDIAHTAMSDHRILRRQQAEAPAAAPAVLAGPGPLLFFPGMDGAPTGPDADRALGMAMQILCRKRPELLENVAPLAARRLRRALETWPDDLPAREAYAQCLGYEGQIREMLAAHEEVLERAPDWEPSLSGAAPAAAALGATDRAQALWQQAVAMNPWSSVYRSGLAQTLAKLKRWPEAIRECDAALQLSPVRLETRILLISCLVQSGDRDRARKEFALLLQMDPEEQEQLKQWFAKQAQ
jgi:Flp pilus assembly protein TadD